MNKHLQKLALAALLVPVSVSATEMRTPWILGDGPIHGPLRYTFEKLHQDKSNLNVWSAMHMKEANRAFLGDGKTQDLSALIFGQSNFTLNQIFPNQVVPLNAPNFNPFIGITTLQPSVEYEEYGFTAGMRWDMPICDKGRIGVRVSVPFRHIEMERLDSGLDEAEVPEDRFVNKKVIAIDTTGAGAAAANADVTNVLVSAYRMDLVGNLPNANGQPILVGGPGSVQVLNNQLATPSAGAVAAAGIALPALAGGVEAPAALALSQNGVNAPVVDAYMLTGLATNVANSVFVVGDVTSLDAGYSTNLPTATTLAYFNSSAAAAGSADDYTNTFPTLANPLGSAGFQANAANTWLVFRRASNSASNGRFDSGNTAAPNASVTGPGEPASLGIDLLLAQFNTNAFEFFQGAGFDFDSRTREGLGDIDLDVFYEHTFNDKFMGELNLGVRLPTGGDANQCGNPYNPSLGNGEHWEIKLGLMGCYQPATWMNMALDARYAFVIKATERRLAAFQGATIKNIGPCVDADVDWGYFVGHFDFNFFHPKNSGIRSLIGYEFYYKTEDEVKFKQGTAVSFLGGAPAALDNELAERNTESMAHKVRFETSAQLLTHFEIFAGGSLTFAGKNVMRDRDFFGGFNIRF